MNGSLQIRQATDARSRRRFLELPFRLYRDDPRWVPPLRRAQASIFAGRTAFFEHAEMALFLAERSGAAVGRAAAIHNHAHNAHHRDRVGFFGFFECRADDAEAAKGLFSRAERWLAERGLDSLRGPVNPSMNAECGLLIEGFDSPPMALMPYNPAWYAGLVSSCGLRKCKDLYAYQVRTVDLLPGTEAHDRMARMAQGLRRRHPQVALRRIDMRRYTQEIRRFLAVFEEARRNNWGYVPVSEAEALETAAHMKKVVDPEIVTLAEVNGEPAGACLAIPNVNRGLAAAKGRLFPLGFLRFFLAMRRSREMRIFGIAALPKYRHLGITVLLLLETILHGTVRGYQLGEASWVLEDNVLSSRTITRALDAKHYKTYRIYEKPIGRGPPDRAR